MGAKVLAIDAKNFSIVNSDIFYKEEQIKVQGCTANWKTLPGRVFCGTGKGHVLWYEFKNGKLEKETEFLAHMDECRNVNLHPHEKYLLSTGRDGSARIWDCSVEGKPKLQSNLAYHHENVASTAFLSNELVVTGSWDQNLAVWKYKDLLKQ